MIFCASSSGFCLAKSCNCIAKFGCCLDILSACRLSVCLLSHCLLCECIVTKRLKLVLRGFHCKSSELSQLLSWKFSGGPHRLGLKLGCMVFNFLRVSIEPIIFVSRLNSSVILKLKYGKPAGLDGLSAEHLLYSHPLLPCVLAKLFNMMVKCSYVHRSFDKSYTVPLLKNNCTFMVSQLLLTISVSY